ncbi:MAG: hypothetical protein ACYDBZ_10980 [Steroidobacteraceae bacterium]
MNPKSEFIILAVAALTASRALAANLDNVGDPVRNAQRLKDCTALHAESVRNEGLTERQIAEACIKAINDGDFKDANISLDGMIKSPSPEM